MNFLAKVWDGDAWVRNKVHEVCVPESKPEWAPYLKKEVDPAIRLEKIQNWEYAEKQHIKVRFFFLISLC